MLSDSGPIPKKDEVSLVLTSCGRLDLLAQTVRSFFENNSYPISKAILIEDSANPAIHAQVYSRFGQIFDEIICNNPKRGQIASIDTAYAVVTTPYIFHCEDDWNFFRPGFIEDSLSVLGEDPRIVTVWLRDLWDTNNHRIERPIHVAEDGVMFRRVAVESDKPWHGFTFNPGLRRLRDYERIKPFTAVGHEFEINIRYRELGFYAAILEQGAIEHLGRHRSERKKELRRKRRPGRRLKRFLRSKIGT